ncbi:MAG: polysaccharide deacetylase family protein, partial [Syntrophaceae bacterium]|nr:polysaccharide deacetylase family protein [Syntrophaceae bacterium]
MYKNEAYYFLKSFIPRRLQLAIRRQIVRRRLAKYRDVWPIDENSAKPPEGWQGWPEGKKFALVLTHDVESVKGIHKCRHLMELDKKHGFKSSFNFVAEDYTVPSDLWNDIKDNGFEIGMHGLQHDRNPFRSERVFEKQAIKINRYLKDWDAEGFRAPSMYHNLGMLHHLDITYDASTFDTDPFEPQPDGMGTIFPFWVPGQSPSEGYVELPYTLPQDFLLFILMKEQTIDIWKQKLDWIVENGGMALIIIHPDYINFDGTEPSYDEYPMSRFKDLLIHIKNKYTNQYWNVLPNELSRFWRDNYKNAPSHI